MTYITLDTEYFFFSMLKLSNKQNSFLSVEKMKFVGLIRNSSLKLFKKRSLFHNLTTYMIPTMNKPQKDPTPHLLGSV